MEAAPAPEAAPEAAPGEVSELESITNRRTVQVYTIADNKAIQLHNVLHVKCSDGTIYYIECTTSQEDTGTVTFHFDRQRVWKSTDDGVVLLEGIIAIFVDNTVDQTVSESATCLFIALYPANEPGDDVAGGITLLENEVVMTYKGEPYTPHPSENLEMEELNVPQWLPSSLVGPMDKDALEDAVLGRFDPSGLPAIIQENLDELGQPRAWEDVCVAVASARLLSNPDTQPGMINHIMWRHPEALTVVHFFEKTDLTVADLRLMERAVYYMVIVLEFNLEVELEVTKEVRADLEDIDDPDAKTLADKFTTLLDNFDDYGFANYYAVVKYGTVISKYRRYLPSFPDVYGLDAVEECEDDGDCIWIKLDDWRDYYMRYCFDYKTDRLVEQMSEEFALEIIIPASSDFKEQKIAEAEQRLKDNVARMQAELGNLDGEDLAASAVGAAGMQSCVICLRTVHALRILRCGHILGCYQCTLDAIEHDDKCAICRQPVHPDDPQPVSQQIVDANRFVQETAALDAHLSAVSADYGAEFVP